MIHCEHHLYQTLSGNFHTTWQRLTRSHNMFPLSIGKGKYSPGILLVSVFLSLSMPFITFPFMVYYVSQFQSLSEVTGFVLSILFILDVLTITLICIIYIMQSRSGMLQNSMYLLTSPIGAAIISVGFIYSLFTKKGKIEWRGREYQVDRINFVLDTQND